MEFRRLAQALVLPLPLLLALSLAGCGADDMAEHDYRQHFPVGVSRHEAVAEVTMPAPGEGLAEADRVRLDQMGREHIRRGAGPVSVTVGAAATDAAKAAAAAFGEQVAAALNVPASEVSVTVTTDGKPPAGTARVSVPVWVADVPSCGNWDWAPAPDFSNRTISNFGCVTQRNTGLMVQNPADLVRMRDSTGRDGNRAVDVLGKYGSGAATGSAKESDSSVSTSGSK